MSGKLLFAFVGAALLAPSAAPDDHCNRSCDQAVGDIDADSHIGYNDVSTLYRRLFAGSAPRLCPEVADVNGDGLVDVNDAFYLGNFVWSGGPAPVSQRVPGDVNNDNKVDVADLVSLGQWLWGSMGEVCTAGSDINEDGHIDSTDFTLLARML